MKLLSLLPYLLAVSADLKIEHLNAVECTRKTENGDTVNVHYSGYLTDGTKFDSSYDRNSPLTFTLGQGRVIRGWEQGLLDMCVGEKRKLIIPPELGYGARGVGPIPANAELIFETELVEIVGEPEKDEL